MTKIFYTIFNLVALSVIIYFGVDIFYSFVDSRLSQVNDRKIEIERAPGTLSNQRTSLKDYRSIAERYLFGLVEKAPEEVKKTEIETLEPTTLKIALLGTITDSEKGSAAIIEDTGKRTQDLYRVGDSVQEAVIKMIVREKVVLRVGDKDEILTMAEVTSSPSSSKHERTTQRSSRTRSLERTITLRQEDIDRSFENMSELLSQARVRPHEKDGVADGYIITGIKSGSLYRRMGLRNGDIIRSVNGTMISTMEEAMSIYNDLKSGSSVALEIERRGQPRTLNYKVR